MFTLSAKSKLHNPTNFSIKIIIMFLSKKANYYYVLLAVIIKIILTLMVWRPQIMSTYNVLVY